MVRNHKQPRHIFLVSTIIIYALIATLFLGTVQAEYVETSQQLKEDNILDDNLQLEEQLINVGQDSNQMEDGQIGISMLQTESSPSTRLIYNEFDDKKKTVQNDENNVDSIKQNIFVERNIEDGLSNNVREGIDIPNIVKLTDNTVKIQVDGSIAQDDSYMLNTITQNYEESKNNQEEIANRLKSIRETQERHMREEQDLLNIKQENEYLNGFKQQVLSARYNPGSSNYSSKNEISFDDVDDDLKNLVSPDLLKNVIDRERNLEKPALQKIYDEQKQRELEAYQQNMKRLEEQKANDEKIERDIQVHNEIERQQEELKRQEELKEQRRKEEEYERIRQQKEEDERLIREQEEARRIAEEEERERQRNEQIRQQEIEQEQMRRAQEEEDQKRREAELEAEEIRAQEAQRAQYEQDEQAARLAQAEREAEIRAEEEAAQRQYEEYQEQQRREAEIRAQEEQAVRQAQAEREAEIRAEEEQAERLRAEQEEAERAEAIRAQQEAQREYDEEQRRLEEAQAEIESQQNLDETDDIGDQYIAGELIDDSDEQTQTNTQEEERAAIEAQQRAEQEQAERLRAQQEEAERAEAIRAQQEAQREYEEQLRRDTEAQRAEIESQQNIVQTDDIGDQYIAGELIDDSDEQMQINIQTDTIDLKKQEDEKRQQLKEQKLKQKQIKESENTNIQSTNNSQKEVDSNMITQIDEFGNTFSFKKAEKVIPLTKPSFMNDPNQEMRSLAGQNLQTKISKENGHHLDKKSIKEQRERAEKFQFVISKNKTTQVTPSGETIKSAPKEDNKQQNNKFLKKKEDVVDSSTLASNVAILCNDKNKASSKAVQHVCELCDVGEVFSLTEENWFKVGLSHNHKKEYQDLLNKVNDVFGKTNLIAGFSKHGDICLSSEQIFNSVNIDLALKTFTYNPLKSYQFEKNPIFSIQPQAQVDEFTFRTSFNKEKKNNQEYLVPEYNNFQMIINGQFFRKIDSSTNLNVLNIVFLQQKLTTFYFGQISVNSYSAQVHFQHDEDQRDNDSINLIVELPSDPISFQRQAFKMFSQDNLQKIIQNMQLTRGIQQIENVKIQSMMITLNLPLNVYQIIMNYDDIVDFQLSLNLNLVECSGWVMVQKDSLNNQFFLESNNLICQIEEFPKYTRLHIKKTNTNSNYFVRFVDDEYVLSQINQDVFYKIHNNPENTLKFEDKLQGLINFESTYLHEIKIEIFFEPRTLFDVKATVGSQELKTIGEFRAKFTRINTIVNNFVSFTFGAENINDLFHFKKSDLVSTVPKSLYIFYSEQDLNTQNLPFLRIGDFGPTNQEIWKEGVYMQYVFDFEDNCNIGKFLIHHKAQVNNLHVKGYYSDKAILLSGDIESTVLIAQPIKLENISINIPVYLDEENQGNDKNKSRVEQLSKIQVGRFYIQSNFQLKVTETKTFNFSGILNYQKDNQGYLQAECIEPWMNAFDKKDLLLSEIMFKGKMNEELHRLESFTINSLSTFGGECFIEMENDVIPRFDVDRCFYGNSQIKINFKDFSQDLFTSYVNFINPQNIFQVLLGYNSVKFATSVTKPIASMQFPKGLSITHTQSSIKDPTTNQVQIPKGFTLTGHAELLGLKGQIVLNINQDKYLLGLFKFDELSFAGGNIVIVETEGGHQNNIVLRIQKDNPSLGELNQLFFQPKVFIFNLQRSIQVSITKEQGYIIEVLDKFFGSQDDIAIRISSPFINEIQNANFKLMALFTPTHLKRINAQLVSLTKGWMNKTQNLFADLAQRVSEVQKDLISLNKVLCDKETCPYNQQCVSTPRSECVKYHQKSICLQEETICLEEKIICSQEVEICQESAVTCSQFNAEDPTVCEFYEENCVQYIKKCNSFESICAIEPIKICTKTKYADDTERCIERQMVCDIELVKDTNCQMECERKRDDFEIKTRVFDKFTNALTNFQRRNQKFTEMVNYVIDNSDSFVSIIEAKFDKDLNELVNENNITVEFSVQSFTIIERVGQDIQNYRIDNYDFRNEEQMIRQLFKKMQLYWASQHSIDEILIAEDSTIILHDILNRINIQASKNIDENDSQMAILMQLGANRNVNFKNN